MWEPQVQSGGLETAATEQPQSARYYTSGVLALCQECYLSLSQSSFEIGIIIQILEIELPREGTCPGMSRSQNAEQWQSPNLNRDLANQQPTFLPYQQAALQRLEDTAFLILGLDLL